MRDYAKFYSLNMLMDVDDHHLYTDKIAIGYVDLTRINLATEKDKKYNISTWARFFTAKTWEEIRMLAQEYPIIEEAASNLKKLTEEEQFRLQMDAWEDRQRRENGLKMLMEQAEEKNAILRQQLIEAGITPKV